MPASSVVSDQASRASSGPASHADHLLQAVLSRDPEAASRQLAAWVHRRGVASLDGWMQTELPALAAAEDCHWLAAVLASPLTASVPVVSPALSPDVSPALPAVVTAAVTTTPLPGEVAAEQPMAVVASPRQLEAPEAAAIAAQPLPPPAAAGAEQQAERASRELDRALAELAGAFPGVVSPAGSAQASDAALPQASVPSPWSEPLPAAQLEVGPAAEPDEDAQWLIEASAEAFALQAADPQSTAPNSTAPDGAVADSAVPDFAIAVSELPGGAEVVAGAEAELPEASLQEALLPEALLPEDEFQEADLPETEALDAEARQGEALEAEAEQAAPRTADQAVSLGLGRWARRSLGRARTLLRDCYEEAIGGLQTEPGAAVEDLEQDGIGAWTEMPAPAAGVPPAPTAAVPQAPSPAAVPQAPAAAVPPPASWERAAAGGSGGALGTTAGVQPPATAARLRTPGLFSGRRVGNRPAPSPAAIADLRAWLPDSGEAPRRAS